jgi:hypothetical protein
MSDGAGPSHPPQFVELCRHAVDLLTSLKGATPEMRAVLLPRIDEALARIDEQVKTLDLGTEWFADEQGDIVTASSALQAIEMDRGGSHVERYVDRAVAALRHVGGL